MMTRKSSSRVNKSQTNFFRPKPLEPPKVGVSSAQYLEYVSSYRVYVSTLEQFKAEFWSTRGPEKAPSKQPKPAKDKAKKPADKSAKNKRRAERKRMYAQQQEIRALRLKTSLVESKRQYAEVLKRPAPQKKKTSRASATKVAGKEPEGRRDPDPPRPGEGPGGSGSGPKPNRKARRLAKFGPARAPSPKKEETESEAEEAEDSAAEEADEQSDSEEEEVVPFVNPFALPTVGMGSRLGVAALLPGVTDDPVPGVPFSGTRMTGKSLHFAGTQMAEGLGKGYLQSPE